MWSRFRLKQRLEAIDFQEDKVGPMIEAIKSGKAVPELLLTEGTVFDIEVVDEDPNHPPTRDTDQ